MSPDCSWATKLLDAARRRNIVFSPAEVEAVYAAHSGSPLARWVQHNLVARETAVLSNEELALWRRLQESPSSLPTRDAAADADWVSIPTTDDEFRSATADLNASTRAIERRSTILDAQSALASRLAGSEDGCRVRKSKHRQFFNQKEAAEVQHVKFANHQLYETLCADLQTEHAIVSRDLKSVHATVAEVLNADDRALVRLNEVSANRTELDVDVDAVGERVAKLTTALRHFRSQAVKDRLDRTYLESLANGESEEEEQRSEAVSADEVQNIHADLGSLYAEIDDVATMLVSHEHGKGVDSTISSIRQLRSENSRARTELVYDKLAALTASLEILSTRLENLQNRRLALHRLQLQSQHLGPAINAPTRHDLAVPAAGPASTLSSRRDRAEDEDDYPAISALLRHFGLSGLPQTGNGNGNVSSTTFHEQVSSSTFHEQVRTLAAKLSCKSAQNVRQILDISETAITTRRAASQSLFEVLDTNSARDLDRELRALEDRIAQARAEIETTRPRPRP
ncbi:hypothetical protein A1O3_09260 [Capronia epimyces CBS 606.96]|uniref:HAUS augmin-like complex subunit 3 N-terminal domain-containing protein n=1 Tax=Capronia epimyces CBS 606.96 TaxID=1182542 RepID=W9Y6Q2_9EURO|nr:uncharacterized protein A1O3_09260 [Capronia epimyces CBS 606.96]EXJ78099.1 hypothetical protein A1O3_09260 [Capronia epimyces CBS 606.96]